MDDDTVKAILLGATSESLSLQFGPATQLMPGVMVNKLVARLQIPDANPTIDQATVAAVHEKPKCSDLSGLLDGDRTRKFVFDTDHLHMEIFEHQWGVRSGFIAECVLTSVLSVEFHPWPKQRSIGDYILDGHASAASLRFAFLCEYDALRSFERQLQRITFPQ